MSRLIPRALRRPVVAAAAVAALIAFPLGALASHQFGDVPDSNPFHGDISAIANAGVTTGCGGGNYCPDRFVTRAEMAAFMNRLGALSSSKTPVVNADKVDGLHANQLVRAATATAGNTGDPCGGPAIFTAFDSTTFTTTVLRQVNAPTDGVLLVFGRVSAERSSGSAGEIRLLGRLTVDGTQLGGQAENSYDDAVSLSCQEGRTMSLSGAVSVTAGNHTVAVQIAKSTSSGGTASVYVGNAAVTTLFVPFGNAGGQIASELAEYFPGTDGGGNR